ncbi:MAG: murein biosynthesis integral membrane protein MurJ [Buchnera aphidicola (Floraphis meitanensis)]
MNILKSLISLSTVTFCSRILGFIRDALIAYTFGASGLTDSFFLAFKIPNLFRRIFAEGFFYQVFIPILSKYKYCYNIKFVKEFISNILGFMIIFLSIFTIFGIFFSSEIISIIAPGLYKNSYEFNLTSQLLKIIFPYIFFISLGSFIGSILNTWNYFFIPSCSSILLNINIIFFILFLSSHFETSIFSLAWAIVLGGIIQLIYQIPFLKKIDMLVLPTFNMKNVKLKITLKKMIVIILGVSTNQISVIINTISASFLVTGAISWIYYADRLIEFISGMFGVSLGTLLLPLLSNNIIGNNKKENSKLLDWALRIGCLIAIPSSISLAILSKVIIIVLFQYGNFSIFDVIMTKDILIFYSIGLIPLILIKILLSKFYSNDDLLSPTIISVFILIITQLMNIIFLPYLKQNSFALSISIAAWINFILLFLVLLNKKYFFPNPGWLVFLGKIFISIIVMIYVLNFNLSIFFNWSSKTILSKFFQLILICFISGCSYLITLFILGLRLKNFSLIIFKSSKL